MYCLKYRGYRFADIIKNVVIKNDKQQTLQICQALGCRNEELWMLEEQMIY